jgi:hypothetical protein
MIFEKLVGKTRFVATKVVGTSNGTRSPFYRIAEVHFPSLQTLRACAQSDGGRETLAHAVKISSGGAPLFFVAEETTFLFGTVSLWDRLKGIASSGYARVCGARAPKCNRIALLSIASKVKGQIHKRQTSVRRALSQCD